MRRAFPILAALAFGDLALSACAYNPDLGRQQMTIVNDASLAQAGEQAWSQALAKSTVRDRKSVV